MSYRSGLASGGHCSSEMPVATPHQPARDTGLPVRDARRPGARLAMRDAPGWPSHARAMCSPPLLRLVHGLLLLGSDRGETLDAVRPWPLPTAGPRRRAPRTLLHPVKASRPYASSCENRSPGVNS